MDSCCDPDMQSGLPFWLCCKAHDLLPTIMSGCYNFFAGTGYPTWTS
jgi:hypothetical protein